MKFVRGDLYHVRFFDHNESKGKTESPKGILNIVGRYVMEKKGYLIFQNWWSDDLDVETRANILKKAVIEARRLE